jgi:hypothetical protein
MTAQIPFVAWHFVKCLPSAPQRGLQVFAVQIAAALVAMIAVRLLT